MENGKAKVWLPCIRVGSGTDVFTHRLAEALERKGVIATIQWFPLRYELVPHLLQNIPAPQGTDIVFTNSWNGFAFKRGAYPLVTVLHHAEFANPGRNLGLLRMLYRRMVVRRYETLSFNAADVIIAVSDFAAASIEPSGFAHKTRVIHNWIDVTRFCPLEEGRKPGRPFRLLFVGKPTRLKGADLLPEIMQRLGANFQLGVAGSVKHWGKRPVPGNTTLLGQLPELDLIDEYRRCDAYLFPSLSEGFGYTVLEAMACGVPVIASNTTALPELVADGQTGILCEAGRVDSFVDACRRIAGEPQLAYGMGSAGRLKAVSEFSEDRQISRYLEVIDNLLANRKTEGQVR